MSNIKLSDYYNNLRYTAYPLNRPELWHSDYKMTFLVGPTEIIELPWRRLGAVLMDFIQDGHVHMYKPDNWTISDFIDMISKTGLIPTKPGQ